MSVQRTPPMNTAQDSKSDQSGNISYGSDSELLSNNTERSPQYVFHRKKRITKQDSSPSEYSCIRDELKSLAALLSAQRDEFVVITTSLKSIREANTNIESQMSLLTTQNEEFRRKIERLELQVKQDREHITILEDKIEDLQRYTRKSSIELKNVPRKQQENQNDLVNVISSLGRTVAEGNLRNALQ